MSVISRTQSTTSFVTSLLIKSFSHVPLFHFVRHLFCYGARLVRFILKNCLD